MYKAKKKIFFFSGHFFFLKADVAGRVFIFIQAKNRCENFFSFKTVTIFFKSFAWMVISSDIIQARPQNLIGKASAH